MMALLDFIFPKYSLEGKEGEFVTESELRKLVSHPRIFTHEELVKKGVKSLDRVFAASAYQEANLMKQAIRTFKYKLIRALGDTLKIILSDAVSKYYPLRESSCLCPVPLHWSRKQMRGFNQAEILSEHLSKQTGIPIKKLLKRTRPTGNQSKRTRDERWGAMRGAFRIVSTFDRFWFFVNKKRTSINLPFTVYLVDDLFTTGATMEECARVLKDAGVKRVEGVVLAYD